MRWLADECVSARLVKHLREAGHDVSYMAESKAGTSDIAVLEHAQRDGRLLLTDDKDFGELVVRRGWRVPGLVLMRIDSERPEVKWERLDAAIARFGDGLFGRYTVIETARFRFRPLRVFNDD